MIPKVDLRRTYLIARRDFLGYIKTWGFWLSFLMPFLFGGFGILLSQMSLNVEPVRYETILDETNLYAQAILDSERQKTNERMERAEKLEERIPMLANQGQSLAKSKVNFVEPPAPDLDGLMPYLKGEKLLSIGEKGSRLNGAVHIYDDNGELKLDYWSSNITNSDAINVVEKYFSTKASDDYLASGNLTADGLKAAKKNAPSVDAFDPTKSTVEGEGDQSVSDLDIIPFVVAIMASGILWLTIFSGAYMLLTSMLEEKLNKLLEMMLSTTRLSEIMLGKLIGVAALTIAAMSPYILLSFAGAAFIAVQGGPETTEVIRDAFSLKLLVFFPVFLVLGYVFYGALFIAMGSLAESMQDAQTLTTPIMLLLTGCIMVVPIAIKSPDSPILTFAAWFPLSAPFAAIARLPLDPPWWELSLSAFFLFLMSVGVIWLAGRIFNYGVLSGSGVKGIMEALKRVVFRRGTAG